MRQVSYSPRGKGQRVTYDSRMMIRAPESRAAAQLENRVIKNRIIGINVVLVNSRPTKYVPELL